jgi:hypothetical protein
MQTASECLNMASMTTKLQNDSFLYTEFNRLYAGPYLDRAECVDEQDVVVDTSRIQAVLTFNSFTKEASHLDNLMETDFANLKKSKESGLWLKPSYFNHSCLPNTKRFFYSDFMMIYAGTHFLFI